MAIRSFPMPCVAFHRAAQRSRPQSIALEHMHIASLVFCVTYASHTSPPMTKATICLVSCIVFVGRFLVLITFLGRRMSVSCLTFVECMNRWFLCEFQFASEHPTVWMLLSVWLETSRFIKLNER